jgi:uncharacterized protein YukE
MQNILKAKTRELRILQDQAAKFGDYTPPYITTGIEDLQDELAQIRVELKRLKELGDDYPTVTLDASLPPPRPTIGWVKTLPVILAVAGLVVVAALGAVFASTRNNARELSPAVTVTVMLPPALEPPMSTAGVNIAVAEFTPLTGDSLLSTEDGRQLRDDLVTVMQTTLDRMDSSLRPGEVRPTTAITGTDPATREANVEKLAQALNATIVLYGRIAPQANGIYLVYPEFYVSPAEKGFDYGAEIIGSTEFGRPVQFSPPLNAPELAEVNAELKARIEALKDVVKGLAHFGVKQDTEAYQSFQSAQEAMRGYSSGQEVIQLLLGAVKLREYRRFSGQELEEGTVPDLAQAKEARKQAESHFAQGLALDHTYARLNLGMGGIALAQATELISPTSAIWPDDILGRLVDARFWYGQALTASDEQSPFGYVPVKAQLGVSKTYLGEYRYYLQKMQQAIQAQDAPVADNFRQLAQNAYSKAVTGFKQVVSGYNEAYQPSELVELAGSAQAMLAELELIQADYLERTGRPDENLYRQTLADCNDAHETLGAEELKKSRLALYYRVTCYNLQAHAFARLDDPVAAKNACNQALVFNKSNVLPVEQLTCNSQILDSPK